jgi:hypothetical protein
MSIKDQKNLEGKIIQPLAALQICGDKYLLSEEFKRELLYRHLKNIQFCIAGKASHTT